MRQLPSNGSVPAEYSTKVGRAGYWKMQELVPAKASIVKRVSRERWVEGSIGLHWQCLGGLPPPIPVKKRFDVH